MKAKSFISAKDILRAATIIHIGTNNRTIKRTPCGVNKFDYRYSTKVDEVNCLRCIDMYLARTRRDGTYLVSKKVPLWDARFKQLKAELMGVES